MKMSWTEKLVFLLVMFTIYSLVAALDTALFYLIASLAWTITWPTVAAVFWVQQTIFSHTIKQGLREDGWRW